MARRRFGPQCWPALSPPPLDGGRRLTQSAPARRLDGRCHACEGLVEESPGSTGIRCRLTAGGGDPRDSATENKPPARAVRKQGCPQARVKRCGKSAPPLRQRRGQGKPHREQDRIGVTGGTAHETVTCDARAFPPRHPGWSREARRKARPRGMAVQGRASGPDRTRLTDRLAPLFRATP
jgi:hypothetical protein